MSGSGLQHREGRPERGRKPGALRNPLYRSGYALALNTVGTGVIGMVFWAVAARMYDRQSLGRSSALISMLMLVAGISQLNMRNVLPRFLPRVSQSAGRFIAYSYGASSAVALVAGLVCITILPATNARWHFVGTSPALAVGFVIASMIMAVFTMEDSALTGLRHATIVPLENIIYGVLKLLLLVFIALSLPSLGIFVAWTLPLLFIVPVINWLIFRRFTQKRPRVPLGSGVTLRDLVRYASVDFIGSLLGQFYGNFLPILVLSTLGAAANGSFYIAWTIATGLTLVAVNFGTSLLVEGSAAPNRLRELTRGMLIRSLLITGFGAAILVAFPHLILEIYGHAYALHASSLLPLLGLAAVPRSLIQITFAVDRVAGHVGRAALSHLALAVLVLGGSWVLMRHLGLEGVGIAWLAANLVVAIVRSPTLFSAVRRHAPAPPIPANVTRPILAKGGQLPARGAHRRPRGRHRVTSRTPSSSNPGVISSEPKPSPYQPQEVNQTRSHQGGDRAPLRR